jgi:hypothetical protein
MIPDNASFTDRYLDLWNEPDPHARRATVTDLWAEDGTNSTPSLEARGFEAITARVTRSYDSYVGPGTYLFRLARVPVSHHQAIRLDWEMITRDTGAVASTGTEFLVLNDEGRIMSDHQFLEP